MSVFCPNIKSEAWLKHTELVGNDLNYLSWIGNKGFAIQYTSKGKVSTLYADLVKEYKDEKLAAKIKALTFSKSIIEKLGNVKKDSKGEYKIEDVKKLLTLSKQEDIQKSDSEILESIVDKYKIAPKVVFKEGKVVVDDIEYSQSGIISNAVDYQLRVVNALLTLSTPKITKRSEKYGELAEPEVLTIRLNTKERPNLENNIRKLLSNKKVTKEQIDFVFDYMKSNNIQEISVEELALALAEKFNFGIEIDVAKSGANQDLEGRFIEVNGESFKPHGFHGWVNEYDGTPATKEELALIDKQLKEGNQTPTQIYSNLSARNNQNESKYKAEEGWEYQELEISTPLITPNIKGHAQFATDNGIGWARVWYNKKTGVVEIQEIQSDLFQKGRDSKDLTSKTKLGGTYKVDHNPFSNKDEFPYAIFDNTGEIWDFYKTKEEANAVLYKQELNISPENQFLQLLNKDSNWVKFFTQAVSQHFAKQTKYETNPTDVHNKVMELQYSKELIIDCN